MENIINGVAQLLNIDAKNTENIIEEFLPVNGGQQSSPINGRKISNKAPLGNRIITSQIVSSRVSEIETKISEIKQNNITPPRGKTDERNISHKPIFPGRVYSTASSFPETEEKEGTILVAETLNEVPELTLEESPVTREKVNEFHNLVLKAQEMRRRVKMVLAAHPKADDC